jgi:hypothetical protein
LAVSVCLSLGSSACIKQALVNGQIEGTRQASIAFDSIGDWELAYAAAANGIVQFEGMHVLAPDNQDALFMLSKAYAGFGYGFIEDDMEQAEDRGDRTAAEYHKGRAVRAYERSIAYGKELWEKRGITGFDEARASDPGLRAWLDQNFTEPKDAADLFWASYAWIARAGLLKDDAEAVANLYVAVAMLEKCKALDEAYGGYTVLVALAAYHSRTATAELDEAKVLFDDALAKTGGKSLIVQFNYAKGYACSRADAALYQKLLDEVIAAEDPAPQWRLTNTIAQRRARRWRDATRMFNACSIDPIEPTMEGKDAS